MTARSGLRLETADSGSAIETTQSRKTPLSKLPAIISVISRALLGEITTVKYRGIFRGNW